MLLDIDRESQGAFRTGSGTVDTEAIRLGCTNTRQTVTLTDVTGGNFKLAVGGVQTANIAFDATAATVKTALAAVVGSGNVAVSGNAGGPWPVDFLGIYAGQSVAAMTAIDVDLQGAGHAIAVAVTVVGQGLSWPVRKYVMVRANGANGSVVMIGENVARVGDGFILSAGQQSPPIYIDDLSKVYLVGGAAGQGYSWIAC